MEVSAPAAQKQLQMMLDDVGAFFSTLLQWLWIPLKTGIEGVCRSLSPPSLTVSCHCSHAQNQTGRHNCPGSLECAVDRVSA